jgi:hypothetical protein
MPLRPDRCDPQKAVSVVFDPNPSGDRIMSLGEQIYLAMVVVVFISFGILMATLIVLDERYEKRLKSGDRQAARVPAGAGQSAFTSGRLA